VSSVFRAFWYSSLIPSNIRSLEELSDSRLPMNFGIWSLTVDWWFKDVLTYRIYRSPSGIVGRWRLKALMKMSRKIGTQEW